MEMELLNKRVERLLNEVRTLAVERARDAEGIECALRARSLHDDSLSKWQPFVNGGEWGGEHRWWDFRFNVTAPEGYTGKQLFLEITTGCEGAWDATNPQFLAYVDG